MYNEILKRLEEGKSVEITMVFDNIDDYGTVSTQYEDVKIIKDKEGYKVNNTIVEDFRYYLHMLLKNSIAYFVK